MANAAKSKTAKGLGGLTPKGSAPIRCPTETKLLRAMDELRRKLRPMIEVERAMHVAVRDAAELLSADTYCFAVITPGVRPADLTTFTGPNPSWDRELLGCFARGERRDPPERIALARVKRRGRPWGVVAIRWEIAPVTWDLRNALTQYINAANDVLAEIERDRIIDVRSKIDRKIMQQLRSHDLFYQILDGLRTLTRYDHSATVLIGEREQSILEVAADKIAWRRGKSQRVGASYEVLPEHMQHLLTCGVCGYGRRGDGFVRWTDNTPADPWLGRLLSEACTASPHEPPIGEALVAPLATRDGLRAVLVIAVIHPGQLGQYEADLVASFLPQVAISLHNSRWAEALEAEMLETERKHAMADLARGVAHDVNNALGATIPLLQQLRADVAGKQLDPGNLQQDLEQIERSVRVCRDIFGGMLRFARTAARPETTASVKAAVDICLMILRDSLRRRNIHVEVNLAPILPGLMMNQSELEQLLLNLMTNARDAMPSGGRLDIAATSGEAATVRMEVRDDGCGIPAEHLPHVQDPFFTTKPHGTGLGLSICRSIVWRSHGEIQILSAPGNGTRVLLELPTVIGETGPLRELKPAAPAAPRGEAEEFVEQRPRSGG